MSIAAGVIDRALEAALGTSVHMPAQDRSPADGDIVQYLSLRIAQSVRAQERRAVGARELTHGRHWT
jgi:hypothetical protein